MSELVGRIQSDPQSAGSERGTDSRTGNRLFGALVLTAMDYFESLLVRAGVVGVVAVQTVIEPVDIAEGSEPHNADLPSKDPCGQGQFHLQMALRLLATLKPHSSRRLVTQVEIDFNRGQLTPSPTPEHPTSVV
jgi:hypothetical protein